MLVINKPEFGNFGDALPGTKKPTKIEGLLYMYIKQILLPSFRIDYKDQEFMNKVRVCNNKMVRDCNLTDKELENIQPVKNCREHYEPICETTYTAKNITESHVSCKNVQEEMCMDNDGKENCISFPVRVRDHTLQTKLSYP